jgi:rod shape-determining protein MreC
VVVGAGGALVGRVTGLSGNSATILLINDTSSTVIGQLGSNQATGSVIGQLGGVLIMENIDSAERLQIGDTVTTAGIDLGGGVRSPFPKGVLIGTVVDVQRDANAVTQTAFIQPTADLERLEYVLIVTDYLGGLPPVEQQPIPCASGGTLPEGEQPCVTATPKP